MDPLAELGPQDFVLDPEIFDLLDKMGIDDGTMMRMKAEHQHFHSVVHLDSDFGFRAFFN